MRLEILKATRTERRASASSTAVDMLVTASRARADRAAESVLYGAHARAEELVREAEARAVEIEREAFDEGMERSERAWAEAALALAERTANEDEGREAECVKLAVEIARQVAGEHAVSQPEAIAELAARVCAPLRSDAALRLVVAPADFARADAIRARLGARASIDIVAGPELLPGDCVAECAGVRVDARLATQLAVIEARLLGDAEGRR